MKAAISGLGAGARLLAVVGRSPERTPLYRVIMHLAAANVSAVKFAPDHRSQSAT